LRPSFEALFFYFLMFSIGFSFLYNFILHTLFRPHMIGWAVRSRRRLD